MDGDCDGADDYDADRDGYPSDAWEGDDCDDSDGTVHPGAIDRWYDGVDGNCDGADDYDADGDGYPSDAWEGDDCDDSDGTVHPGVSETWYDGVDGDCDGADDYDADGDGFPSDGWGGDDCDDATSTRNPEAVEDCSDGADQDCDARVDCEDADCAASSACVEDCSNEVDDDDNGQTDCEDMKCVGAPGCPAFTVHVHDGTFRAQAIGWGFGLSQLFDAQSLSGSVVARTQSGGTTSCSFSGIHISWMWSAASSLEGWVTGTPTGSCGAPLDELFPRMVYGSSSGYLGVHRFSSPWWASSRRTVSSTHSGWFAQRSFIRSFDSVTRSGSLWRGSSSYSFQLLGETHTLGSWP